MAADGGFDLPDRADRKRRLSLTGRDNSVCFSAANDVPTIAVLKTIPKFQLLAESRRRSGSTAGDRRSSSPSVVAIIHRDNHGVGRMDCPSKVALPNGHEDNPIIPEYHFVMVRFVQQHVWKSNLLMTLGSCADTVHQSYSEIA